MEIPGQISAEIDTVLPSRAPELNPVENV